MNVWVIIFYSSDILIPTQPGRAIEMIVTIMSGSGGEVIKRTAFIGTSGAGSFARTRRNSLEEGRRSRSGRGSLVELGMSVSQIKLWWSGVVMDGGAVERRGTRTRHNEE